MKKGVIIGIIIGLIVIGAIGYFVFLRDTSRETITLQNPTAGLSVEESVKLFDESFVKYLLYSIGAAELKSVPFTSNKPRIEFYIDEDVYNAVVDKRVVKVYDGAIDDEDIIIRTSKEEAVKMIMDKNYVVVNFKSGGSSIELVASKTTLFAKGYLGLYSGLTGEELEE